MAQETPGGATSYPSLWSDYLGLYGERLSQPEKGLDTELMRELSRMREIAAKYKNKDLQVFATFQAKRLEQQVKMASTMAELRKGLSATKGRLVGDALDAMVRDADSLRDAEVEIEKINMNVVRNVVDRAEIAAQKFGGVNTVSGKAAAVHEAFGALGEAGLMNPGAGYTDATVAQLEMRLGIRFGTPEFNALMAGDATARDRANEMKRVAEADGLARRKAIEDVHAKTSAILDGVRKATDGTWDPARDLPVVDAAMKSVKDTVDTMIGTTPEQALAAEEKAISERKEYAQIQKDVDKTREILFGEGTGEDASRRELIAKHVMSPAFRTWAAQRGLTQLGDAAFDDEGKLVSYVPGAHDARAVVQFTLGLHRPDQAGRIFNRATGHWYRVPVQDIDVESLRGADGKFASVTDSAGGVKYLSPGDLHEYELDAGVAEDPEVEAWALPGGEDVLRASVDGKEQFYRQDEAEQAWVEMDAPGVEPTERTGVVLVGKDGKPLRFARASDLAGGTGLGTFAPADEGARALVAGRMPPLQRTDTPPPPGGAWVIGKELALRPGDLKYKVKDPVTGEIHLPTRVLGAVKHTGQAKGEFGEAGIFLVDPQGKIIEESREKPASRPEYAGSYKGLPSPARGVQAWLGKLAAKKEEKLEEGAPTALARVKSPGAGEAVEQAAAKPAEEAKPVEGAKPAEEAKPVEGAKPEAAPAPVVRMDTERVRAQQEALRTAREPLDLAAGEEPPRGPGGEPPGTGGIAPGTSGAGARKVAPASPARASMEGTTSEDVSSLAARRELVKAAGESTEGLAGPPATPPALPATGEPIRDAPDVLQRAVTVFGEKDRKAAERTEAEAAAEEEKKHREKVERAARRVALDADVRERFARMKEMEAALPSRVAAAMQPGLRRAGFDPGQLERMKLQRAALARARGAEE